MRLATRPSLDAPFAIAWEETACLLCGNTSCTPILEAPDRFSGLQFLIVHCTKCGLSFTNPRPDADSIVQFYPEEYRGHQPRPADRKLDAIGAQLALRTPARLLDFGCGAGDFLEQMRQRGWIVTGLDSSESAVRRARARGLAAHIGTLPHPLWADASFEAITMRQSLEHAHAPLEVLRAAYQLLTPGGRLFVTTPNFESLAAHWFGTHWYGLDLPRHLTHFTPATLRMMLRRAGFDRVEVRQETHRSWIRHSAEANGTRSWFLQSRLGSRLAAQWAAWMGRAEGIFAIAGK